VVFLVAIAIAVAVDGSLVLYSRFVFCDDVMRVASGTQEYHRGFGSLILAWHLESHHDTTSR